MFQLATPPVADATDWTGDDPYAIRFATVGGKGAPEEAPRLAIRLPAANTYASSETFVLALMAASSGRTLWTLRHTPTYWRIAPLDIPVFRLCQAALQSARTARDPVEWLIVPPPAAPAWPTTALYVQHEPRGRFVLLSRNAAQPAEQWWLSYAD